LFRGVVTMAVRMELARILIRELNDCQIIELREAAEDGDAPGEGGGGGNGEDRRSFPIVIGLPEAQAIERRIKGITIKRPQTHDLLASVIGQLGGELKSITITDLSDHTFFATLDVMRGGELLHIDSRPSDAIALGVANDVPIYVEEHVLEAAMTEEG
jgi:bifunctional DNase/RNase